ncbi:hypothetical protein PHA8399_03952 [Leisingera aquaemixtae]|uniref:Uncharacterized protein n=1 Tax=Leisingera aquaemixtae TaxID=1396826 RepID=A0A0P1HDP2_9RHOB|nr:hypothetical protein PHA8399_03952 [Leisingera aquaemixtae]
MRLAGTCFLRTIPLAARLWEGRGRATVASRRHGGGAVPDCHVP